MTIRTLDAEVCEQVAGGGVFVDIATEIGKQLAIDGIRGAVKAVADHLGKAAKDPGRPTNQDALGNVQGPNADGGGGKVICTELCRNGVIEHDVWMADIRYSRDNFSAQTMRELAFRPICWSLGIVAKARDWQSSQTMPFAIQ
jgi:hypothetical protein